MNAIKRVALALLIVSVVAAVQSCYARTWTRVATFLEIPTRSPNGHLRVFRRHVCHWAESCDRGVVLDGACGPIWLMHVSYRVTDLEWIGERVVEIETGGERVRFTIGPNCEIVKTP